MKNLSGNCLDGRYDNSAIASIILASIKIIYSSKHFGGPLM